jgi:hypothetical protein
MFATLVLVAASLLPAPSQGDISLLDAKQFHVTAPACRALWLLSNNHGRVMRVEIAGGWNNSPATVAMWEEELEWRNRCWFLLDDALNCPYLTAAQKLQSLKELRGLIGDAAYLAGIMPAPLPHYRR